jgi:hypothetical protein
MIWPNDKNLRIENSTVFQLIKFNIISLVAHMKPSAVTVGSVLNSW